MKKILLLGVAMGFSSVPYAQNLTPQIIPEFYSSKISANGAVILSQTDEYVMECDAATGNVELLDMFDLGAGNCISADGSVIVGSTLEDAPVIWKNGEMMNLGYLSAIYPKCDFNCITGDGKRVAGFVTNLSKEKSETMSVPMYMDFNSDGTLGEVNLLPYPKKDWAGQDPQYVYPVSISNDGKRIVGQVKDNSGYAVYPIIFSQGADGEWSYTLPTESLINPQKRAIPEYPGEFPLTPPNMDDYMTAEELQAYQEAEDAYYQSGETLPFPYKENYMTEAEINAFNEAVEVYNAAAREYNAKSRAYYEDIFSIMFESVFFYQNGLAMDSEGKKIYMAAEKEYVLGSLDDEDPEYEITYPCYSYDVITGELSEVKDRADGAYPIPKQVLPDGSVIGVTPMPSSLDDEIRPPLSYVIKPGANEFISLQDKLSQINAAATEWLTANFTKDVLVSLDWETGDEIVEKYLMTGNAVVSDDWTVVSGGVLAYMYYSSDPEEESANAYESYLIRSDLSGISAVVSDLKVVETRYYDLNGIEVKNPGKGIYVERKLYNDGSAVTAKKVM
ncbi:MAG: hypothetical protein K2H96_04750 [Muribaculaceae bacterium]|nr:hypothetical protein [Muribaculaceae bacterium]